MICESLQLCGTACALPITTLPEAWASPKPDPLIVTCVPAAPACGEMADIAGVFTVNAMAFDQTPPCWT
jgi:hypothetical protein